MGLHSGTAQQGATNRPGLELVENFPDRLPERRRDSRLDVSVDPIWVTANLTRAIIIIGRQAPDGASAPPLGDPISDVNTCEPLLLSHESRRRGLSLCESQMQASSMVVPALG